MHATLMYIYSALLFTKANSRARQYKGCEIMITTGLKSYPFKDKMRSYTVTGHIEISHTKPEQNAANGIRMTVPKQKQQEVQYR